MKILQAIKTRMTKKPPNFVIGPEHPEGAYMNRWYVISRNKVFNIYLHQFLRSDEDFALHDHPWLFNVSFVFEGVYREHTIDEGGVDKKELFGREFMFPWIKFRWGKAPHRVELLPGKQAWTIFITGPVVRVWGFHCPSGWIPFHKKITMTKTSSTGRRSCP